ncbi:hypothetical protein DSO57_1026825 [Entomophthora muscae]|uniref:Uncharacterized protein n=1 Tax=Entomophthora muscae TaxID=34485 RepID=A0ACC2RGP6_9FUNG|nr:hypothetical protein DSO57_1026825 [Entomophthora muscae]
MRYWLSTRSLGLPDPLLAVYCLPGAPFGPIHFTEYPLKTECKEYTLEKILEQDYLARVKLVARYNRQDPWNVSEPKLFRDRHNFLPAYQLDMKPPVTPKPMLTSAPGLPLDHTNKLFGIVYITLTGVIDTIIPAAGLWSWVGKSMPYLIKLAPILWWALPAKPVACVFPENDGPAAQGWLPDTAPEESVGQQVPPRILLQSRRVMKTLLKIQPMNTYPVPVSFCCSKPWAILTSKILFSN